ncbi:MAG: chemotaxis protein CheX, partial [bacterium]|nr:chemotaxis protein CheX [bacterium]
NILDKPIKEQNVLKAVEEALSRKSGSPSSARTVHTENINTEIVKTIVDTVVLILSNITRIEIVKGQLFFLPVAFTTMGIGSIIDFIGDFEGQIMIDMTPPAALFLASRLLKENITEMSELVQSAIAELGNTVAGRVASSLSRFGNIRISTPEVLMDNKQTRIPADRKIFIFPLGIGNFMINVDFFIKIREK